MAFPGPEQINSRRRHVDGDDGAERFDGEENQGGQVPGGSENTYSSVGVDSIVERKKLSGEMEVKNKMTLEVARRLRTGDILGLEPHGVAAVFRRTDFEGDNKQQTATELWMLSTAMTAILRADPTMLRRYQKGEIRIQDLATQARALLVEGAQTRLQVEALRTQALSLDLEQGGYKMMMELYDHVADPLYLVRLPKELKDLLFQSVAELQRISLMQLMGRAEPTLIDAARSNMIKMADALADAKKKSELARAEVDERRELHEEELRHTLEDNKAKEREDALTLATRAAKEIQDRRLAWLGKPIAAAIDFVFGGPDEQDSFIERLTQSFVTSVGKLKLADPKVVGGSYGGAVGLSCAYLLVAAAPALPFWPIAIPVALGSIAAGASIANNLEKALLNKKGNRTEPTSSPRPVVSRQMASSMRDGLENERSLDDRRR